MKYLEKYKIFEAGDWRRRTVQKLEYTREQEIRMYLVELLDMNWIEHMVVHDIIDGDFQLKNRINYLRNPIYQCYMFDFTNKKILSMNKTIELMESITSALERLREDGFMFKIFNFTIGSDQSGRKRFTIVIYHRDDIVPWEDIFVI